MAFVNKVRVSLTVAALVMPVSAFAQAYRGEIRGTIISSTVALGAASTATLISSSQQAGLKLIVTQVCTNIGLSQGTSPNTYLNAPSQQGFLLPGGCTTFNPGIAWPVGVDLQASNATGNNAYIMVTGVLTDI